MRGHSKWLALTALLAACEGAEPDPTAENAPGFAAERHVVQHSTSTIPEDGFSINPCNGETVHFTGIITEQVNTVAVGDATLHLEVQDLFSASGTGLATAVSYRVHATSGVNFNSPTPTAPNAVFTERDHFHFHADTRGLDFMGAFFIHVIVLPSGEVKVTREVDSEDGVCLG
jgi:hypothetical protein